MRRRLRQTVPSGFALITGGGRVPLWRAVPAAGAPRPSARRWAQPPLPPAPGAVCGRCVAMATAGLRRSSPLPPCVEAAARRPGRRPWGGWPRGMPRGCRLGSGRGREAVPEGSGWRAFGGTRRALAVPARGPAPVPEAPAGCGGEGRSRREPEVFGLHPAGGVLPLKCLNRLESFFFFNCFCS